MFVYELSDCGFKSRCGHLKPNGFASDFKTALYYAFCALVKFMMQKLKSLKLIVADRCLKNKVILVSFYWFWIFCWLQNDSLNILLIAEWQFFQRFVHFILSYMLAWQEVKNLLQCIYFSTILIFKIFEKEPIVYSGPWQIIFQNC